jgi:hypothetical protein
MVRLLFSLRFSIEELMICEYTPCFSKNKELFIIYILQIMVDFLNSIFALFTSIGILLPT